MSKNKNKRTNSKNQSSSKQSSGIDFDVLGKMHSNLHNNIKEEAIASTQCSSAFYQEYLKQAESPQERAQAAASYEKHEEAQRRERKDREDTSFLVMALVATATLIGTGVSVYAYIKKT
ncbi:MAG TPA: hypothetical protein PK244_09850 [Pseudomonadales bacterium]|jgi:cobalamin biosynthesis Mg chelatase CobN|nr:hypothetical protein [Pseudomonadales bacterium]